MTLRKQEIAEAEELAAKRGIDQEGFAQLMGVSALRVRQWKDGAGMRPAKSSRLKHVLEELRAGRVPEPIDTPQQRGSENLREFLRENIEVMREVREYLRRAEDKQGEDRARGRGSGGPGRRGHVSGS